jgi:hypothetical protein
MEENSLQKLKQQFVKLTKHQKSNNIDVKEAINEILNYKTIYENLILININSLKEFESFKYENIRLQEKIKNIENINQNLNYHLRWLINVLILFLILIILILFNII